MWCHTRVLYSIFCVLITWKWTYCTILHVCIAFRSRWNLMVKSLKWKWLMLGILRYIHSVTVVSYSLSDFCHWIITLVQPCFFMGYINYFFLHVYILITELSRIDSGFEVSKLSYTVWQPQGPQFRLKVKVKIKLGKDGKNLL